MNFVEMTKTVASSKNAVYTSSQTNTLTLDTLGYRYASIDVLYGPPAASTSSVAQTLTLQQSDTEGGEYGNITGFTGDLKPSAYAGQTVASSVTTARLDVDLRGKKRYLQVKTSPNTDLVIVVSARLSKGEEAPYDTATKGAKGGAAG